MQQLYIGIVFLPLSVWQCGLCITLCINLIKPIFSLVLTTVHVFIALSCFYFYFLSTHFVLGNKLSAHNPCEGDSAVYKQNKRKKDKKEKNKHIKRKKEERKKERGKERKKEHRSTYMCSD